MFSVLQCIYVVIVLFCTQYKIGSVVIDLSCDISFIVYGWLVCIMKYRY